MSWTRYLPVGAFVILVIFLGIGLTRDPSVIPTKMIDREVPRFALPELREPTETVTESALTGRVTLLNVFGSWCVACLQEHPTLMQLAADDFVRIVGVNWRDERSDALDWLDEHGDPYDTIIFDELSDLAIEIAVTGAPETFIIDPAGRIRYKQIGPITPDVWRRTIRPILDVIAAEEIVAPAPFAVEPRVDAISKTLRCVVCNNQSVYESRSEVANDMRRAIQARISAGDTDAEIQTWFVQRYGSDVLMNPQGGAVLTDADLIEDRTESVSKTLRCVVCQNQSIYDSNAPLAQDMRRLVRKRVIAGDTDEQAREYLRFRYGDYVLLNPPFQWNTIFLWIAPLVLMAVGAVWFFRRRKQATPVMDEALTDEDRSRIKAALDQSETSS